ncbi:MAG: lycopene cyclase domain-containing protein [Acidimicrobiia bacterium]|nr:lycopene cyclase domain-containing protein [Acidimicrobiia bacterium]
MTSLAAAAGVVVAEQAWFRTGVFRSRGYWISMAICSGFMIAVDGWMSKLSAPIVIYNEAHTSGLRFPWDIPTEEFLYAFAMLTLPVLVWERDHQLAQGSRR